MSNYTPLLLFMMCCWQHSMHTSLISTSLADTGGLCNNQKQVVLLSCSVQPEGCNRLCWGRAEGPLINISRGSCWPLSERSFVQSDRWQSTSRGKQDRIASAGQDNAAVSWLIHRSAELLLRMTKHRTTW